MYLTVQQGYCYEGVNDTHRLLSSYESECCPCLSALVHINHSCWCHKRPCSRRIQ